MVARTAPLFAEVALFCSATGWRARAAPLLTPDSTVEPGSGTGRTSPTPGRWIIDVVAAGAVVLPTFWSNVRCLDISGPWAPDLVTASAFDDPSVSGRLVVPFNWGEYAIWHWGPRLRVSMDGRRETVYGDGTVKEQGAITSGDIPALTFFDRLHPEYAWLPGGPEAASYQWLSKHGYSVDIHSDKSFVARRDDLAPLQRRAPHAACFP